MTPAPVLEVRPPAPALDVGPPAVVLNPLAVVVDSEPVVVANPLMSAVVDPCVVDAWLADSAEMLPDAVENPPCAPPIPTPN